MYLSLFDIYNLYYLLLLYDNLRSLLQTRKFLIHSSYCECSVVVTVFMDIELSKKQTLGACACGREALNTAIAHSSLSHLLLCVSLRNTTTNF